MVVAFVTRTLVCCDYIHRLCVRGWFQSSSDTMACTNESAWRTHPLAGLQANPWSLTLQLAFDYIAAKSTEPRSKCWPHEQRGGPPGGRRMLHSTSSLIYSFTSEWKPTESFQEWACLRNRRTTFRCQFTLSKDILTAKVIKLLSRTSFNVLHVL